MALINVSGFSLTSSGKTRIKKMLKAKQRVMSTESLRLCAPLIPRNTGALIASGKVTEDGIVYTASYARDQYNTKTSRPYDGNRGGKWFERMKTEHKEEILAKADEEGG